MPAAPEPIDRWRRIMNHVRAGQPLDAADAGWLLQASQTYLNDPAGVRLDVVLGLHPRWGEAGWWTLESRSDRDAILAEMDQQLYSRLDVTTAARLIVAAALNGRQSSATLPPAEADFLARISKTGRSVPGHRQVKNILRKSRGNLPPAQISRHEFPREQADIPP